MTNQHQEMLDQVLDLFALHADYNLRVMTDGQTPAAVLVQGDTTTTFAAALAAFYARIPVGHVEAGLRTWRKDAPFPEELNRTMTTALTEWHFAPTKWARENFGAPFEDLCRVSRTIVARNRDVELVYPVHLNPSVQEPVRRILGGLERVHLLAPVDYATLVGLLRRAHLVLTDSGGIQEEAPTFGKPVLVMRETTERPEGVEAGTARLVGTAETRIVSETERLPHDPAAYAAMATAHNPYGDGHAAERIAETLQTAPAAHVAGAGAASSRS